MHYTIKDLRKGNLIIFEAKMGSHAYGTNIPTSDIDLRGVFIQPLEDVLKYGYKDQVSDKTNDIVFYELKRFLELVKKNNPNILELLFAPDDVVIHKDSIWDNIESNARHFITKQCRNTFAGYAIAQIKKARGYNKKMNWEESQMTRRGVLDFCYILEDGGSIPVIKWIENYNEYYKTSYTHKDFSLAKVDHAHDVYAMYLVRGGIVSDTRKANDVQLISIPKGIPVEGYLTFNKDAYSTHCKRYNEYQTWLNERNEDRFKMNKDHGKNYDSKNMAHCIRLLDTALEVADGKGIIVRRPKEHIELLMSIRHGEMEYEDLLEMAELKIEALDKAFEESNLPDKIYDEYVANLELKIREKWYKL